MGCAWLGQGPGLRRGGTSETVPLVSLPFTSHARHTASPLNTRLKGFNLKRHPSVASPGCPYI